MKRFLNSPVTFILSLLFFGVFIVGYIVVNSLNPDSVICVYKVYKQTNGTYEVWWVNMTRHPEGSFNTYEEAKAFQIKQCKDLKAFETQSPSGHRVK